jgi:hypothetical protein
LDLKHLKILNLSQTLLIHLLVMEVEDTMEEEGMERLVAVVVEAVRVQQVNKRVVKLQER